MPKRNDASRNKREAESDLDSISQDGYYSESDNSSASSSSNSEMIVNPSLLGCTGIESIVDSAAHYQEYLSSNKRKAKEAVIQLEKNSDTPGGAYFYLLYLVRNAVKSNKRKQFPKLVSEYKRLSRVMKQSSKLNAARAILKAYIFSVNEDHQGASLALEYAIKSEIQQATLLHGAASDIADKSFTFGLGRLLSVIHRFEDLTAEELEAPVTQSDNGSKSILEECLEGLNATAGMGFRIDAFLENSSIRKFISALVSDAKEEPYFRKLEKTSLALSTLNPDDIFTTRYINLSASDPEIDEQKSYVHHLLAVLMLGKKNVNLHMVSEQLMSARESGKVNHHKLHNGYWNSFYAYAENKSWLQLYGSLMNIVHLYQREGKESRSVLASKIPAMLNQIDEKKVDDADKIRNALEVLSEFFDNAATLDASYAQIAGNTKVVRTLSGVPQISDISRYGFAVLQEQACLMFHENIFGQLSSSSRDYLGKKLLKFPEGNKLESDRYRAPRLPKLSGYIQQLLARHMFSYVGRGKYTAAANLAALSSIDDLDVNDALTDRNRYKDDCREAVQSLDETIQKVKAGLGQLIDNHGFDAVRYFDQSREIRSIIKSLTSRGVFPEGRKIICYDRMTNFFGLDKDDNSARQNSYAMSYFMLGLTLLSKRLYNAGAQCLVEAFAYSSEINYTKYDGGLMHKLFVKRGWMQLAHQSKQALTSYIQNRQDRSERNVYEPRIRKAQEVIDCIDRIDMSTKPGNERIAEFCEKVLPSLVILAATQMFPNQRDALSKGFYAGNLPKAVKNVLKVAIKQFGLSANQMSSAVDIVQRPSKDEGILSELRDFDLAKIACSAYVEKKARNYTRDLQKKDPLVRAIFKRVCWIQGASPILSDALVRSTDSSIETVDDVDANSDDQRDLDDNSTVTDQSRIVVDNASGSDADSDDFDDPVSPRSDVPTSVGFLPPPPPLVVPENAGTLSSAVGIFNHSTASSSSSSDDQSHERSRDFN